MDSLEKKVAGLFSAASQQQSDEPSQDHSQHIKIGSVTGSNNIIGHWGDIHLQMPAPVRPKIKIVLQPGPEHVSEEQKARLKELVAEIVRLESLIRKQPKGFASIWNALNGKCRVTSYHLIPAADYPKAEKYLREWIGRLSSAKSAPKKDGNWRNRKYSYIFTNVKQLQAEDILRARLLERHGTDSLKGISDADLDAIYHLVASWKKAGHAPG